MDTKRDHRKDKMLYSLVWFSGTVKHFAFCCATDYTEAYALLHISERDGLTVRLTVAEWVPETEVSRVICRGTDIAPDEILSNLSAQGAINHLRNRIEANGNLPMYIEGLNGERYPARWVKTAAHPVEGLVTFIK